MTVRNILIYSQHMAELRRKSDPIVSLNKRIRRHILDLKETLQAGSDGIGLAAPQINIHKRIVIVCLGAESDGEWLAGSPVVLINTEIVEASNQRMDFDGCLSFPGLYGESTRPHHLRITGLNEDGNPFDRVYKGFNAVIIHHEIDHLNDVLFNDVLFIDRIENLRDLYTLHTNEQGELVHVPVTLELV
jgi:peptide deformylase